jgi:hypothetical protein
VQDISCRYVKGNLSSASAKEVTQSGLNNCQRRGFSFYPLATGAAEWQYRQGNTAGWSPPSAARRSKTGSQWACRLLIWLCARQRINSCGLMPLGKVIKCDFAVYFIPLPGNASSVAGWHPMQPYCARELSRPLAFARRAVVFFIWAS